MRRIVAFLLVAFALSAPVAPAEAQKRSFKAWKSFCSQGLCVAETKTTGGKVRLQFRRGGASDAAWAIAFTDVQRDIAPGTPVTVQVDDEPVMGFAPQTGYETGNNRLDLTDPALSPILFSTLRNGDKATLSFTHSQGFPLKLDFSLAGLAAAILWIDEQQGRAGDQAVAAGPVAPTAPVPVSPVSPVPPVPASPEPESSPAKAATAPLPDPVSIPALVRKQHLADGECRDFDAGHMQRARVADTLDEHHTLYLLPCYTGAYNVIYRAWVADARYPKEVRRELFVGYSDDLGWYGKDTLINADYDAATKTLSAFEKGRGLGDCGSVPTYRWHESFWRLLEFRSWEKCDGTHMPERWPVIYQHPDYDKG